jgi:ketosteroid isomerase-like protein
VSSGRRGSGTRPHELRTSPKACQGGAARRSVLRISTPEQNKATALEFLQAAWADRDLEASYERFVTPGQVAHLAGYPEPFRSREESLEWARTYQAAFADQELTIETAVAEGDLVVVRFRTEQTHRGPYMGVAPMGTRVSMTVLQMLRFEGGKIAEVWFMFDPLDVMQQLGVLPPGEMPKPLLAVINTVRRLRARRRR